jgi:hypothetical protein
VAEVAAKLRRGGLLGVLLCQRGGSYNLLTAEEQSFWPRAPVSASSEFQCLAWRRHGECQSGDGRICA